jgi:hypothetical protein
MAYGFMSKVWRQVRVMFIPKPGKADCTKGKGIMSYQSVNFSHENDGDIRRYTYWGGRGGAVKKYPLHRHKHVYQKCKFTETTLHNMITCIRNATEQRILA